MLPDLLFHGGTLSLPATESWPVCLCRFFLLPAAPALLCIWYWKLSQLFRQYEHGQIFAAETIRCIKVLGWVFVLGWLMTTAGHFMPPAENPLLSLPPGEYSVVTHNYRADFVSFDFGTGIDFGSLLVGVSVVLAAWITDEGRKIQEEQELTV